MKRSCVIPNDGYTVQAYIAPIDGIFDCPVRFEFRPMLVEQASELHAAREKLRGSDADRKAAQVIVKQILSWDVKGPDGEPWELSASGLLRLEPTLFYRILSIVNGNYPSDQDPEWDESLKDEHVDEQLPSALEDQRPGAAREAANEKN